MTVGLLTAAPLFVVGILVSEAIRAYMIALVRLLDFKGLPAEDAVGWKDSLMSRYQSLIESQMTDGVSQRIAPPGCT